MTKANMRKWMLTRLIIVFYQHIKTGYSYTHITIHVLYNNIVYQNYLKKIRAFWRKTATPGQSGIPKIESN